MNFISTTGFDFDHATEIAIAAKLHQHTLSPLHGFRMWAHLVDSLCEFQTLVLATVLQSGHLIVAASRPSAGPPFDGGVGGSLLVVGLWAEAP